MLTSSISGFAVFVIITLLFIFRKTVKTITRETPEAASIIVSHITDTVRVNALEDRLEQQDTLAAIQNKMNGRTWISAKSLMAQMENLEHEAQNPQPSQPSQPQQTKQEHIMRQPIIKKEHIFHHINDPYYMNNSNDFLIKDNNIKTEFYIGKTLYRLINIEYNGETHIATNSIATLVEHGGYIGEGFIFPATLIFKRIN